jgi:chemotaxis regulatin CheY-phosphate phosphatase CheZ
MSDDSTALVRRPDANSPSPLAQEDYDAICAAVMETWRGRWFLTEYARRNRHADTTLILTAIDRLLDAAVRKEQRPPALDQFRLDIVEMAKAIARTKAEISSIKPDAAHHGKIGEATGELDAIVHATETATSGILAAAEKIQEIAWTMREQGVDTGICDQLDGRATDIYTACSFQDITGQRTSKVIAAMRFLESRINAMIDIWGIEPSSTVTDAVPGVPSDPLVNGPARPGTGLDQGDIDMVMGAAAQVVPAEMQEPVASGSYAILDIAPMAATQAAPPSQLDIARSPDETLASITSLSEEEKIALFS